MKFLPVTFCFQPLSVEEGKSRVIQDWKRAVRKEKGRTNTGNKSLCCEVLCVMGQLFIFLFPKKNKDFEAEAEQKALAVFKEAIQNHFLGKCVSVCQPSLGKIFPGVLYSTVTHQLTGQKITFETSKAFQHLTSHKAARRPLAVVACLSTQLL